MKELNIKADQKSLENDVDVILVNGEAFTFKSSGITRRVFANADKTKVIKVLVEKHSFDFNKEEQKEWDNASEEKRKQLAQTRLLENGYIEQEYLHTLDDETTAEWLKRPLTMSEIRFAQSCRNDVGFDADGNLKCFDLHEYKQY